MDVGTRSFSRLENTKLEWICYKGPHQNLETSFYHSFELKISNSFSILGECDSSTCLKSPDNVFLPSAHSSPVFNLDKSSNSTKSLHLKLPKKTNWRTLVVNYQGVRIKKAALTSAKYYIQPDVILGQESKLNKTMSNNSFQQITIQCIGRISEVGVVESLLL